MKDCKQHNKQWIYYQTTWSLERNTFSAMMATYYGSLSNVVEIKRIHSYGKDYHEEVWSKKRKKWVHDKNINFPSKLGQSARIFYIEKNRRIGVEEVELLLVYETSK